MNETCKGDIEAVLAEAANIQRRSLWIEQNQKDASGQTNEEASKRQTGKSIRTTTNEQIQKRCHDWTMCRLRGPTSSTAHSIDLAPICIAVTPTTRTPRLKPHTDRLLSSIYIEGSLTLRS